MIRMIAPVMFASLLGAQVRPLHSRDLTRLSQVQIAAQLKANDAIFVPVGAVEANGILPSGRDYVYPLAYAATMAEAAGALYLPGVMWSYPGTTLGAPATLHVTPTQGTAYLKAVARSLLRQGFKRQIWLSASHGPAVLTVGTMAREFFDETRVPLLYIDMDQYAPKLKLPAGALDRALWGAHAIAGRLEDLPLQGDYGEKESRPPADLPKNEGLAALGRLGLSGSTAVGSWMADTMAHGVADLALPKSAAEREEWGRAGRRQIEAMVEKMRLREALDALREHERFTRETVAPRLREWLP